ncbi:sensor histidine kinase KdpD [Prevotella sp. P6B1]|uniref:sensor histidine kinase n=1 Tax=Prevotella sp. P6B1 TaxID=1410613 RepID=UPI00051C900D|nr:HAMP domain-containing sensor histidine kinase [Prevotella sp. P6B1]
MKQYLYLLLLIITLTITGKGSIYANEIEQELAQRLQAAQVSGDDSAFYDAHQTMLDYQMRHQAWDKYYRVWMTRVIYDVNNKHFHRAFTQIHRLTDDVRQRHQEKYLYISNMCLGFFFSGRNQPEMGETYFRRALKGVDAEKEPVSVFNCYLSLSQVLSFKRPVEAMACLDSLPKQMLENPIYDSGVLGYRCIIASRLGDRPAFNRYFARYDSIRHNNPAGFNAANLQQVMVCHYLMLNDYKQALAWCDSVSVPQMANELRLDIYEKMGDWQRAFRAAELKDSLEQNDNREVLEEYLMEVTHDIDLLTAEQEKAELRRKQLMSLGLMAAVIIALLIAVLIYRYFKNLKLKEQFLQLQEARRSTEAGQAIRRAFVTAIQNKLQSPINVLLNYARIFNDPEFRLKPEERSKRYSDIVAAAHSIESLMDPVLDSFALGDSGITEEEKRICQDALRSPLVTLIGSAEVIIDADGQIPHDEYMKMREEVGRNAYLVATSTRKLLLFSLYGDNMPVAKNYEIGLNEMVRTILNSYDLHFRTKPKAIEFMTDVADEVTIRTNTLLQELMNCLLDNVVKYAVGNSLILSCHAEANGTYSIAVSNEGMPISVEDVERIFVPFVRLSPDEHSLGIGLPLARSLAVSMGYTLTIDTTYSQGARFVVSGL